MKKVLAAILCLILVFSFAGCSAPAYEGPESALVLLETVWEKYSDTDKFPAAGGDFNEENMKMDAPGKYGLEDKDALMATFCLNADSADLIDDAASLTHGMLMNNFTAGAFRVKEADNVQKIADSLKENLANNMWLCGAPERFVIIKVGKYVVSAYGSEQLITTFKDKVAEAYEKSEVLYNEAIA